ncbi:ABC-2 type transport system permease protein [Catalinimonas alkaloidigena]|uniref:ABC transporter permease n=1 Tax=Catalinimonas alkaloidigena TaxID=1075417 RepID=UPI0024060AF0|nr:ABC transporter permease [Catalinimonas alkaloidigena]MDF9798275.1 ABC-2 type transport system permease protein [Catalinimonas alkaloidigena]
MRKILFLIQKEFLQIFRNRSILPILFVMPIVQIFLLSYAANFEIKHVKVFIIDHDKSQASRQLLDKLLGSTYFQLTAHSENLEEGYRALDFDQADVLLNIPMEFERDLYKQKQASVQLLINAINGTKAGLANAYISTVLQDFNQNVRAEMLSSKQHNSTGISVKSSNWYNPELNYQTFMVPGILVLLVTMIAVFLSAMNIVREKEIGTIEQLNVTTIKKYQFIIGKLLPFLIIALAELTIGLLIAHYHFQISFEGSLGLIYLFAGIYLVLVLGMGMFVSTITDTQQQAMFVSWFFLVIFILMSGLFTPIENMPDWAQAITRFNPVAYFVKIMRMVLLKGSGFADVAHLFGVIALYAVIMNLLAIWNYRKTSA